MLKLFVPWWLLQGGGFPYRDSDNAWPPAIGISFLDKALLQGPPMDVSGSPQSGHHIENVSLDPGCESGALNLA